MNLTQKKKFMQDISEKIIKEIEEKNIKPTPKAVFNLIGFSFWVIFVLSVAIGVCAAFTSIFMIVDSDWDVYPAMGYNFWTYLFTSLPYLWLVVFLGFLMASFLAYRATKNGYKKPTTLVLAAISVGIFSLVGIFFAIGANINLHGYMMNFPIYDRFIFSREDMWRGERPSCLGGIITNVPNNIDFILKDFDGHLWVVNTEQAKIYPLVVIKQNNRVRIVGEREDNNKFMAREIWPWEMRPFGR